MAVIALTSARGAPGTTTTALGLALTWPRPVVLVEADMAGSSSILAGYMRGTMRHDRGVVDLAVALRNNQLHEALSRTMFRLSDRAQFIPGVSAPTQAATLGELWGPLAAALAGLEQAGTDVIVDAGRLGAGGFPTPLLRTADAVLLTTRTNLPAIAATRARCDALREDLATRGSGEDALQLLVIGEGQPYSSREVVAAVGVPVLASIAWDQVNADVLSLGAPRPRRFDTSSLIGSLTAAHGNIVQLVTSRRARLGPVPTTASRNTHG